MSKSTEEKADTAVNGVSTGETLGSPADSILYQKFKALKHQRNHHLIDEPDFDTAVMQLFDQELAKRVEEAEEKSYRKGYQAGWETGRNGRIGPSREEIKSKQEAWLKKQMKGKTNEKA